MKISPLVFIPVIIVGLCAFLCFSPQVKTISSVEKIGDGIYYMEYSGDYKLEEIMRTDLRSTNDTLKCISEKVLFGYPIDLDENEFSCSAFLAQNAESEFIVGRNFDLFDVDAIVVKCNPEDGYKSYSTITLSPLGGEEEITDDLLYRISTLVAPYVPMDGLNEKGLSVSILELENEPTNQQTGKTGTNISVAMRMILDKCATVDEAVALVSEYDIHSSFRVPYHLFVSDKDGKSVVIEWPDNEMKVVDADCVTNFQLSEGEDYGVGFGQERYKIIKDTLTEKQNQLSEADAMQLLKKAEYKDDDIYSTQWSVVYNSSDFSLDICKNADIDKCYHIG